MQKIITKEEKEKKVKMNQLIIGGILIALMILSTLGYALNNGDKKSEKIEYRGIIFERDNSEYWKFNIQGYEFITKYNPEEVKDIYFFNYRSLQDYVNKPLYFVGDYQEPVYEVSKNLNNFVLRFNSACLNEMNCSGNYPVKNCSEDNVIVIEEIDYESEKEGITQEDNCIFIKAGLENQTRYADAFLFELLDIK